MFYNCLKKSLKNITSWNSDSEFQKNKIKQLLSDLNKFINFIENKFDFDQEYAFNKIYLWIESNLKDECIEYIVSIMMEPYEKITNPLVKEMSSDEEKYFNIPTGRTIFDLRQILEKKYENIIKIDFKEKENNKFFWFVSKNKEEPRIADRFVEEGH